MSTREWMLAIAVLVAGACRPAPTEGSGTSTRSPADAGTASPSRTDAPDIDGDGVLDADDACPAQPAPTDDGCPTLDSDGDGIPDAEDKCPMEPEVYDGQNDEDGCPC